MANAKFLPKVIEYDRYQPEFYEDTFTYIKKRSSGKKIREGLRLYKKENYYRNCRKRFSSGKRIIISINGNRN